MKIKILALSLCALFSTFSQASYGPNGRVLAEGEVPSANAICQTYGYKDVMQTRCFDAEEPLSRRDTPRTARGIDLIETVKEATSGDHRTVYTYRDKSGILHYTENVPVEYKNIAKVYKRGTINAPKPTNVISYKENHLDIKNNPVIVSTAPVQQSSIEPVKTYAVKPPMEKISLKEESNPQKENIEKNNEPRALASLADPTLNLKNDKEKTDISTTKKANSSKVAKKAVSSQAKQSNNSSQSNKSSAKKSNASTKKATTSKVTNKKTTSTANTKKTSTPRNASSNKSTAKSTKSTVSNKNAIQKNDNKKPTSNKKKAAPKKATNNKSNNKK